MSQARRFQVEYRSDAALLVAYATQLVKGQLVLDSREPLAEGTPLDLKLVGPAVSIPLAGEVAWTRAVAEGPAHPAGTGVALTAAPDGLGEAIDRIAFEFRGLRVLVAALQTAPRALLIRYLRSIITCDVVELDQKRLTDDPAALLNVDLTVIDLDSAGVAGYELYARLRQHTETGSAPVLALAQMERDRARAASLGFDEALANPPPFAELQAATLRSLAKPTRVTLVG
jgi:CheY-like chemotaxis protein